MTLVTLVPHGTKNNDHMKNNTEYMTYEATHHEQFFFHTYFYSTQVSVRSVDNLTNICGIAINENHRFVSKILR